MKRYEKMSKEEIMEQYECCVTGCKTCLVYAKNGDTYKCDDCIAEISMVLNEEIKTVPRCHKCKSIDDFDAMYAEWDKVRENSVKYHKLSCYMMEEVET